MLSPSTNALGFAELMIVISLSAPLEIAMPVPALILKSPFGSGDMLLTAVIHLPLDELHPQSSLHAHGVPFLLLMVSLLMGYFR